MDNDQKLKFLQENFEDKGVLEWNEDVPDTEYWYDADDNMIHTSCGVTIPFDYDIRTQMAKCWFDIINAVQEYYASKGTTVTSLYD